VHAIVVTEAKKKFNEKNTRIWQAYPQKWKILNCKGNYMIIHPDGTQKVP
jgi:hypothetical protein